MQKCSLSGYLACDDEVLGAMWLSSRLELELL